MADIDRDAIRKRRGAQEISPEVLAKLKAYMGQSEQDEIRALGDKTKASLEENVSPFLGQGKFRDTGRESSLGESIDSLTGAPLRRAIAEMQAGNFNLEGLKNTASAFGADPRNQPTGYDIASRVTDNPYLGTALATGIDLANLPIPASPGVAAKVKDIAPEAEAILSRIKTPEQAVALKGAEREQYLNALDQVYGDRAKRAKDMGFGDKTWYHGTGADIDNFELSRGQTNAGGPTGKHAIHFSKDPKLANQYAYEQAPQWYKDHLMEDNRLMHAALDKKPGAEEAFKAYANGPRLEFEKRFKEMPEGYERESGNNVIPVKLKTKQMVGQEMDGGSIGYDEADLLSKLKGEGKYGGVVFKNAYDNLNHIRFENPDLMVPSTDIAAVFEPNQIRSVNAAFDPRFKDSDLLLAGKSSLTPSSQQYAISKAIEARRKKKEK